MQPFVISNQHPDWVKPLLIALDKRGIIYKTENPVHHFFAIEDKTPRYGIFFNSMSPDVYLQHCGVQEIFHTLSHLKHLENHGVRVINGYRAFAHETSKSLQLILMQQLCIKHPKTHVASDVSQIEAATAGLRFPVVIKANVGGKNEPLTPFGSIEEVREAIKANQIGLAADHTLLLQEFIPARGGYTHRVETLGGKYSYAVRKNDSKADAYIPSAEVIKTVETIVQMAGVDIGGVEYVIDDRNGDILYYEVNTHADFVPDVANVTGFDPYERVADYLENEIIRRAEDIAVV
ncbi:ATP-grasp domain-containing protein [Mucilaginibacter agri]|uniref:ATP-grasp domain-containing protein n=1 Tax=Mucilaginibacter agri TaxID=2695265 RepID=A0A965ZFB6_9SPHI|nr:hypothetical protein [Mucilaginibacter agri]NCD69163.1 hypothetical protein [Mucilaginibacter agri]